MIERLQHSFLIADRLQAHVQQLLLHGSMYGVYNSNLLFHASVPMNEDKSLKEVMVEGQNVAGRELMERVEQLVRAAYDDDCDATEKQRACDYFWYLWCGPNSPLFDKSKMSTFERYFIEDKATHKEEKGWYYSLRNEAEVCDHIMDAFGVTGKHRHDQIGRAHV